MICHPLEPIYDKNSRILILGTIPSVKSREYGFYYAHPQNRFFKVLSTIFEETLPNTKEEKIAFLKKHHIALFDVLKSCDIIGSKDSTIKNFEVNDLSVILQQSEIEKVFTTGKKAYELYQKHCYPITKIEAFYLPSTSPLNVANFTFEQLVDKYKIILEYVQ